MYVSTGELQSKTSEALICSTKRTSFRGKRNQYQTKQVHWLCRALQGDLPVGDTARRHAAEKSCRATATHLGPHTAAEIQPEGELFDDGALPDLPGTELAPDVKHHDDTDEEQAHHQHDGRSTAEMTNQRWFDKSRSGHAFGPRVDSVAGNQNGYESG